MHEPPAKRVVKIPKRGFICQECGEIGWPRKIVPGSFLLEVFLYFLFVIPGLIYTVYRSSHRQEVCPVCRARMLPLGSAGGHQVVQRFFQSSKVEFR